MSNLDYALQYAGRGWSVFPCHHVIWQAGGAPRCSCRRGADCPSMGKHPRTAEGFKAASNDPEDIAAWWSKWPDANIAIATGAVSGLTAIDLDGAEGYAELQSLAGGETLGATLTAQTGSGAHLYYRHGGERSSARGWVHVRGEGGYVVAPPSNHKSGRNYQWLNAVNLAELPVWLKEYAQAGDKPKENANSLTLTLGTCPDYLKQLQPFMGGIASRALTSLQRHWTPADREEVESALATIDPDTNHDTWLKIGMALHSLNWQAGDGSDGGLELWDAWSATARQEGKYLGREHLKARWRSFRLPEPGDTEATRIGTLFKLARDAGWIRESRLPEPVVPPEMPPSVEESPASATPITTQLPGVNGQILPASFQAQFPKGNPLIQLNEKYAVIGDLGGKCMILGWVPSRVDTTIKVPSFQTFRSFAERYSNQYISIKGVARDGSTTEEPKQVGPYWLKWPHRTGYEGIDLVPGAERVLDGNVLNLWSGFAVQPIAGNWSLMQRHIVEVLAGGDAEAARYIARFAAWAVQNPGERAEAALVFRGSKGSGKGTFANALKRLFGQHGLQIFNSKHLVGAFNGHLRNCLMLFADEAFWAGDKQGESVLKGMLTEPALIIEQKGVDAVPWKNRLHVIMAANAEWIVPASHDERRYAVFDVSSNKRGDREYFRALYQEIDSGGMAAMLHDLLAYELGDWHPREVIQTEALRVQKERSMDPRFEWWEELLQNGELPYIGQAEPNVVRAAVLLDRIRESHPRLRDVSATGLGRFMRERGCDGLHRRDGSVWKFDKLSVYRQQFVARMGGWKWRNSLTDWIGTAE